MHRSPLPDARLLLCDRLIAFDHHKQRVHLVALADAAGAPAAEAWLTATEARARGDRAPSAACGAATARGRCAALRRPRGPRGLPRQHRRLQARDLRGRELRDLPDHRAAQRRRDRPGRRLPRPARPQPRAARGAAAPRRPLRAELLARALPARRPRAERRVQADQGHRPARRPSRRGRLSRRRAARRREVARREPHDRRPRAQRPRPRVRAGERATCRRSWPSSPTRRSTSS